MKFVKMLMACGAAMLFPYTTIFGEREKRKGLVAPRHSRPDSECSPVEHQRRNQAAIDKRERRAAKLRRENP